jgi:hypothetical protein
MHFWFIKHKPSQGPRWLFHKHFIFQEHEIMEYILNMKQNICDRDFFGGIYQQAYVTLLSYRFEMYLHNDCHT